MKNNHAHFNCITCPPLPCLSYPILDLIWTALQGLCGACWAFVATSSVEAQVRIAGGKQIPLSVQELVDCDTALNRGCNGGNPLYAFEYTMTNALTSWDDYPYRETVSMPSLHLYLCVFSMSFLLSPLMLCGHHQYSLRPL